MEKPHLTVGLPVHNDADGVLRAVPAILGQTWAGSIRLIVIDDASTDGTADALWQLAAMHEQLEVVTNTERRGTERACDQVLELAGEGYLAWADSRSVWVPRKLELQLAALLDQERRDLRALLLCAARVRVAARSATIAQPGVATDARNLEPATLIGNVEHFRAVGGLDLHASSTQEFLRRFVRHGGRLIRPPDDTPLVTVMSATGGLSRSWRPWDVIRGVPKQTARVVGRALPLLRRSGILALAHRAGIVKALGMHRAGRTLFEEARATADAALMSQDRTALVAKIERATEPAAFLRVEQESRDAGLLHTAETALRRGLEWFPDDHSLRLRLIELLPLRRNSSEAAELWTSCGEAEKRLAGSLTYVRAARALRESGTTADAMAVAAEAARRWPSDRLVRDELRITRSALVEWEHAITVAGDSAEGPGTVHDLGFLAGKDGPLTAAVSRAAGQRCQVSIAINGLSVATTDAAPSADTSVRTVSLRCDDALTFVGDGDVITVESDGRMLSMQGRGSRCEVTTGYKSHFSELRERIGDGYVFTKFGTLKRSHTPDSKRLMLRLFAAVSRILAEAYGYRAFPIYGNLLGAIRSHDFIAHDVGGFDMGYLSAHSDALAVRQEFMEVCRGLLARGYFLRVEPWSVYVRPTYRSRARVDLNFAWFTEAGEFQVSGGWLKAPVTDVDHFRLSRTAPLFGQIVPVPGNAEDVLTQLYGPDWAVPDQGFGTDADMQRDSRYLLTVDEMLSLERIDPDRVEARLDQHPDLVD